MLKTVETEVGGRLLTIETGRLAKQASGSVTVRYGDSVVLVTAVSRENLREDIDYFPLTVDYLEKTFSAGKIPGGFYKREGKPSDKEIITARCIDRPIRPLFPKGFFDEVQIIATLLSADPGIESDVLAITGASAALVISDIPFNGPVAGVRVGRINGNLICNPTFDQSKEGDLDLVVAGTREAVVMVEGSALELPEEAFVEALDFAHRNILKIIQIQDELRNAAGKPKKIFQAPAVDEALVTRVKTMARDQLYEAVQIPQKQERYGRIDTIKSDIVTALSTEFEGKEKAIVKVLEDLQQEIIRKMVIEEKHRLDGRQNTEIRPISCDVSVLPRTHGSALFTRGETQVLVITTLGTSEDEQRLDSLIGEQFKRFMLHYNFPPFSVGEVKFLRGPSRRDIGHGNLAERSLSPVLPQDKDFPYTIRIVSEVLESNGSSSMATVCGSSLALMDGGVPIRTPVAGIAMGLIKEGDAVAVLSDILGDEDHIGDMDFKVAGTRQGITGFQMDVKAAGNITQEILKQALYQAREGRLFILNKMNEALQAPRADISIYAPRIRTIQIPTDRIRDVIGPGGKVIRGIVEQTGAKIDIEDSGDVHIASANMESLEKAIKIIQDLTRKAEPGEIYLGKVKRIMDFGAFVEILPGIEGLVHISQLDQNRVERVTDILKEGDEVMVKVLSIDQAGKIRLSRKEALGYVPKNRTK
ncbi:MAG TPA: polyribonucleotide nucleotidyltransferase [Thermodesulfobacteriota bacterium]|nr:polyribonucleotide nucleotidyltransferase [Deltaproteobacteria bacterium]HNU71595.1 polyribonucleotide nucleotidyltransferase [Thermodesulfobacteriota bacterium]